VSKYIPSSTIEGDENAREEGIVSPSLGSCCSIIEVTFMAASSSRET